MFCVSEAEATAIRTAFEQRGEFAAAVESRSMIHGIGSIERARVCMIATWKQLAIPAVGRASRKPRSPSAANGSGSSGT